MARSCTRKSIRMHVSSQQHSRPDVPESSMLSPTRSSGLSNLVSHLERYTYKDRVPAVNETCVHNTLFSPSLRRTHCHELKKNVSHCTTTVSDVMASVAPGFTDTDSKLDIIYAIVGVLALFVAILQLQEHQRLRPQSRAQKVGASEELEPPLPQVGFVTMFARLDNR